MFILHNSFEMLDGFGTSKLKIDCLLPTKMLLLLLYISK